MKTKLSTYAIALGLCIIGITNSAKAQTTVYSENFTSAPVPAIPTTYTDVTGLGDWGTDDGMNYPACTFTNSSGGNMLVGYNGGDGGAPVEKINSVSFSTTGRTSLTVTWNELRANTSGGAPILTLYYSTDGSTFTNVPFTDVTANDTWQSTSTISLPAPCENQGTVYLRYEYKDNGNGDEILIDDILVQAAGAYYYLQAGGTISSTSSWGINPDGSGANPSDFTSNGQIFYIQNNASVTLSAPTWAVSGTGVIVYVGDGTTATNFIVGSTSTFTVSGGAIIKVQNNGTLTFQNSTYPVLTSTNLVVGSTIDYAYSGFSTMATLTYQNLNISSGTKTFLSSNTVNGALTISSGAIAVLTNAAGQPLTLKGTIAGAGTITGLTNSKLIIGGTDAFGTINFTGGAQTLGNLTINRTGTYTISLGTNLTVTTFSVAPTATGVLDLNGNTLTISGSSTLPTSSGGLLFSGSATSNLSFLGAVTNSLYMNQSSTSTSSLSNLTLNKSGATLTLGNALNIIDSICPTAGTIASGGNLNLVYSSASKTGRVGMIGASGAITGNVTTNIQRPGGNTQWCLMGLPGIVPSPSTFAVYEGQFPMTCASCPDGTAAGFTSVTSYNEPTDTYPNISNTTNAMSIGKGYWFYMGYALGTTAAIPIHVTGTVESAVSGITFPLTFSGPTPADKGYNLIANPVPSPISWAAFRAGNASVNTSYYVYSPNNGSGAYIIYDIITGSSPAGLSNAIAPGQGFYVLASGATTLTLHEGAKTGASQALVREANPSSVQSSSGINYFRIQVSGSGQPIDEAVIEFNPNAITGRDIYDAPKLSTGTASYLQASSSSYGTDLTINANPALTTNYSIPVKMITTTTGSYLVNPTDLQNMPTGGCIILHDNYTGIDHDLRAGAFSLTLTDTETVARFVLNITITPLNITTNTKQASCNNTHDGLISVVGNDAGPWNYTWKNASGTVVKTTLNKATSDSLTGLNNGVYSVDITTVGTCNSATQTFTITAPAAPTSVFTAPTQVNVGTNVGFTNNSIGATNYIWNFGDGGVSSQPIPTYAYNMPGTYTITLEAIIASCNDTVSSTQVIQIDATTGIKRANSGSGDITLSRDGSENYLQFDYPNQTKVNITVYNILGQTLLSNVGLIVVNDRIYLNINDSKNQVLYVTITNLNNNQQTTKKFVND
ncbi:MAG TPA: PKD domain-containing protein [Bacteroidia bacterium]